MLRQARERPWASEKLLQEPRDGVSASEAATLSCSNVLERLGTTPEGLTSEEAGRRLATVGPNAILSHHARPFAVLARQFRSPLLGLLVATAAVSFFLGERSDALAIGAILGSSVILGFSNEYRAEARFGPRLSETLFEPERLSQVVDGARGILVEEVRRHPRVAGRRVFHVPIVPDPRSAATCRGKSCASRRSY